MTNEEQKCIVYLKKNVRNIDETHNTYRVKSTKVQNSPNESDGMTQGLAELTKVQACEHVHKLYV